jgi:hypothetical protein
VITKRGIKRASADVGFMFIAYNLRRLMNIIDRATFTKFLQELVFSFYYGIAAFIKAIICKISHVFFYHRYCKLLFRQVRIPFNPITIGLNYI